MNIRFFFKTLLVVVMTGCSLLCQAQSAGDKLYAQGQELQKTQTVNAQNKAIAKYQQAKKAYDSTTKKNQCDSQIEICRNTIKSLSKTTTKKNTVKKTVETEEEKDEPEPMVEKKTKEPVKLSLSPSSIEFKAGGKGDDIHEVEVSCNYDGWEYSKPDWLEISPNGNKLVVRASENDTDDERTGEIVVTCNGTTAKLYVYQKKKFSVKGIFKKKK